MQREILKLGHPTLRKVARPITKETLRLLEIQTLIDDMIETMHAENGAGLAAPQVGESLRICVAQVAANERYPQMPSLSLRVWVNPSVEIISPTPMILMYEGCLSVPDMRGQVLRPGHVRVRSLDRNGQEQVDEFEGPLASVAAPEIDHLDGILFVDRVDPKSLCRMEEFQEFVAHEDRIQVLPRSASDEL
jgi:peptide deformylase